MAENQQVHILKLIAYQTVLVLPVLAWFSLINYGLQSVLPKNRKRTFSSLLVFAIAATLFAVLILSFIRLTPTATVEPANLPEREALEELFGAEEAEIAEAATGASDVQGLFTTTPLSIF